MKFLYMTAVLTILVKSSKLPKSGFRGIDGNILVCKWNDINFVLLSNKVFVKLHKLKKEIFCARAQNTGSLSLFMAPEF